jgi:hypothetical protein
VEQRRDEVRRRAAERRDGPDPREVVLRPLLLHDRRSRIAGVSSSVRVLPTR